MRKNNFQMWFYIIIAIVIYISLAIFQYYIKSNDGLYATCTIILFIISLIIGLFIQKIQSKEEFQENLRSKAYGAIRRLSDIETLVNRGLANIENKGDGISTVIFQDISDTLRSAKYDWADVIENDLIKIKDIEAKNQELFKLLGNNQLNLQEKTDRIERLENEISELNNGLPLVLSEMSKSKELENFFFFAAQELVTNEIGAKKELLLQIEILDSKLNMILESKLPLIFSFQNENKNNELFLVLNDDHSLRIGRVINRYKKFGIYDNYLSKVVFEVLNDNFLQEEEGLIIVDDYSLSMDHRQTNEEKWISIQSLNWKLAVG